MRIAIFCDGTWNSPHIAETTHVHKLQSSVRNMPSNGQVSVYFPGIGTDARFDGPVQTFFNRYGGGAFGWGLDSKVKQAYQFICDVYKPGDEIYLFGFSRGAFTARSVAGMIRKCGIVTDISPGGINKAFALYRKKGPRNHPDSAHIRAERRRLSPKFATSQADLDWRSDDSEMVKIAYMGVWDTVGARGLPLALLGPVAALWNRQYRFHDMQLSSLVKSARHAVAIDEMRAFFEPSLWDNLDGPKGLNKGEDDNPLRPYQQMWFVGDHGTVGGSADTQELAAFPLMWVLEGAGRLVRDPDVTFPPTPADALVDAPEVVPKSGLLARWRSGPDKQHELHVSAQERWEKRADYRPETLEKLF